MKDVSGQNRHSLVPAVTLKTVECSFVFLDFTPAEFWELQPANTNLQNFRFHLT